MRGLSVKGIAALITAMLMVGCSKLPKQSQDFDQVSEEMTKVAVMPPSFQLQKVGAFSGDLVSEMNHDIEMVVKEAADSVVEASNLSAVPLDMSDQALTDHPELRAAAFEQEGAVTKTHQSLQNTGKSIDIKYDGNIDTFADLADCDYFAFIEGNGFFKTGGAQAKEAALSVLFGGGTGPGSATYLSAFIVDANRGKVVWYNEVNRSDSDPRKRSHLLNSVKELFKPLLGKSTVKWDGSRDEELIDKYKQRIQELETSGEKK